jgi:hypothetical protein
MMSKGLRLSEKWFNRGLWLIAFIFASFLIGLGGTIIGDLPQVEKNISLEDFIDKPAAETLRESLKESSRIRTDLYDASSQAQVKLTAASNNYTSAKDTFNNWIATRQATAEATQNDELVKRTKALDDLKALQRTATVAVDRLSQETVDAEQNERKLQDKLYLLEDVARKQLDIKLNEQAIHVFLYRLALTLPLLGIAGWLFAKKRHTPYWPFVWGFIYFALFAFFVELVPYLPSYGGYIRYIVGIILTVVAGRYAIIALNQYLEKQKLAELQPENLRREELSYDTALARFAKNVCPGCERNIDLKDATNDFCPHCGIGLHDYCVKCEGRKNAFAKFCQRCGTSAAGKLKA